MLVGGRKSLFLILVSVVVATVGYGVSFPLLAISLDKMGISSGLIGLNAAMPALGWVLVSIFLPKLHDLASTRSLMLIFLIISLCGLLGFVLVAGFWPWLVFRFLFGGGLGMFFRVVEYWLNTVATESNRGRTFGIYSVCFLGGIIVGSVIQPAMGTETLVPYGFIAASLTLTIILLFMVKIRAPSESTQGNTTNISATYLKQLFRAAPIALAGVIAYGLFEDVPAYLLSIYALKTGFSESIAAYTLAAFALGNVLFAIPLGILSDKVGRIPVLYGCAIVGGLGALLIPLSLSSATVFLSILFIWGGCIGSIYSISLSVVGDRYQDENLISANASFGIFYAFAALIGPLGNGLSMQILGPNGLMLSCGLIFAFFLLFAVVVQRKEVRYAL